MRMENEKHRKEIQKLKKAAEQTARWADKNESTKIGFNRIKEHDRNIATRAYIGTKTKKMQSRVQQMERRITREIEEKEGLLADLEETPDLKLVPLIHHKETLVNIRDLSVRYANAKKPVFSGLTLQLNRGDRIALHGANGCGKSTLLKLILQSAGIADPVPEMTVSGICETASGLIISCVSQDTSGLKGSILDFCRAHALEESLFCAILRQLDLDRVQFSKNMEEYSEGQKKKAALAASLLTPAHLYLWDEPFNYIDVFSRMQIEKLLLEYQPTMLFVEHDVRFRQNVATHVVEMSNYAELFL